MYSGLSYGRRTGAESVAHAGTGVRAATGLTNGTGSSHSIPAQARSTSGAQNWAGAFMRRYHPAEAIPAAVPAQVARRSTKAIG